MYVYTCVLCTRRVYDINIMDTKDILSTPIEHLCHMHPCEPTSQETFLQAVCLTALGYFESCWSQQGLSPLRHIESSGCVPPIFSIRNKANDRWP